MVWGRRITAAAVAAGLALAVGCGGEDAATVSEGGASTVAPAQTFPASVPDDAVTTVPATTPSPGTQTGAGAVPAITDGADVDAAREVLRRYVDAFVAADGAAACDLLTEESAEAFLLAVGSAVGATTCADAFTSVTRQVPTEQRDAFRSGVIDRLTVSGDTATGRLTVIGVSNDFRLVRRFGDWKIANLPGQ